MAAQVTSWQIYLLTLNLFVTFLNFIRCGIPTVNWKIFWLWLFGTWMTLLGRRMSARVVSRLFWILTSWKWSYWEHCQQADLSIFFTPPPSLCCHQSDSLQSCVISDRILRENTFEHLLKAMLVPSPGSHLDVLYSLSERQKCCILWLADFFWFIGYGFMWFSVLILVVFRGAILGGF